MYYLSFLECITEQSNIIGPCNFALLYLKSHYRYPFPLVWPLVSVKFEMKAYPGNNFLS